MAANINRVLIAGNLTRDPEVRFLSDERSVANFGIAVNRKYRGGDNEMKEETTFLDIEAWGKTAENVGKYLAKGRAAFIEGRLKLDTWDDKDSGAKRSKLKVVADSVQFLGGKSEGDSQPSERHGAKVARRHTSAGAQQSIAETDDEPPF